MSTPQDELTILETGDAQQLSQLLLPIQPDDHVQGPAEARLTLVEYGDYQCPPCGELFITIRQIHEKLANDVRIVYRHYPLSGSHPLAQMAAEAAEAASAQNKFWEMHGLLFEHQSAMTEKSFDEYAEQLALDIDQFRKGLKDRTYESRVREDFKRGVANGVYGTPGLFVNGVRHNGAFDAEAILADAQNKD
jgi:protein-disulfide isomerase